MFTQCVYICLYLFILCTMCWQPTSRITLTNNTVPPPLSGRGAHNNTNTQLQQHKHIGTYNETSNMIAYTIITLSPLEERSSP